MSDIVELTHTLHFEAAHLLPELPADHKCRRLHGHSFVVDIVVRGPIDARLGWLIDYGAIKEAAAPIVEALDHRYLNEIAGLSNPTSERLAVWIWQRLAPSLPALSAITVRETCRNACTYRGPG